MGKIEESECRDLLEEQRKEHEEAIARYEEMFQLLREQYNKMFNAYQRGIERTYSALVDRDKARNDLEDFLDLPMILLPKEPALKWREKGGPQAWYEYYLECLRMGIPVTHKTIGIKSGVEEQTVSNNFSRFGGKKGFPFSEDR